MNELPAMQRLADTVIQSSFGVDPARWPHTQLIYLAFMAAAAALVFVFALHFAGLFIFFERRIAARMQSRLGPNRVGPNGVLQWLTDGLKCLFKEDLIPKDADQPLFRLAPYFVVMGMLLAFAAMPFSSALIATDIDIGILFVLGVTSLVVIGLMMGGWGSNSKWALLGGMRSAAQVISYEIPAALSAMTMIVIAGSLSMQQLIQAQGGAPYAPGWGLFHSPFTFAAFFVFFAAQLAEGNRTPFDLPEAESELVSGYNTEYSGMRFLMFFLGEFANIWILCAVSVALVLGGWQIPWGTLADGLPPAPWVLSGSGVILALMLAGAALPAAGIAYGLARYRRRAHAAITRAEVPGRAVGPVKLALRGAYDGALFAHGAAVLGLLGFGALQLSPAFAESFAAQLGASWAEVRAPLAINGLQLGIFVGKTLALVFVVIQLRWTLPRLRVDQMMALCWKYLVPISFACLMGTLIWELIVDAVPLLGVLMRWVMFLVGAGLLALYTKRVKASFDADRENYEHHTGQAAYFPPWRLV